MTTAEITEAIEAAIAYMAYAPFTRYKDQEIEEAREALRCILAERAEREKNPGVWDGAPEDATLVELWYGDECLVGVKPDMVYTRELPKTRAREIAERWAPTIEDSDIIEAAILEYAEGLK